MNRGNHWNKLMYKKVYIIKCLSVLLSYRGCYHLIILVYCYHIFYFNNYIELALYRFTLNII